MKAADIMTKEVVTINEEATIDELCDILQEQNINGLPVVDEEGNLKGVVTMEDVVYGAMGKDIHEKKERKKKLPCTLVDKSPDGPAKDKAVLQVKDIMTSPAIYVDEQAQLIDVCTTLWNFRIHRMPVVKGSKVTGIISSLDFCRAVSTGRIKA